MNETRFDGVVKPARRGGWTARGVVISVAHSQLIETQVEPRAFATKALATQWLKQAAAERAISAVTLEVAEAR